MEQVNITIDGKPITTRKDTTILEAALENGLDIPHLCYYKGLSRTGVCRLCGVKVKIGNTWLNKTGHGLNSMHVSACTTEVVEGMEVIAHDEELTRARKLIIEMLFAQHWHDCLVCEANGVCELQKYAYQLGIEQKNLRFPISEYTEPIDASSALIIRDLNKCILCGRCVRACHEITAQKIWHFFGRGSIDDSLPKMNLMAGFNQPLAETNCVFCGQCVQSCPVGALTEKKALRMGRAWEMQRVRTTCPYCGVGCQMWLHVKDGRITKVTAVEDAAPNQGRLCVKGRFGYDFIYSDERLKTPLIRENGQFREASWDEALNLVVTRFQEIIAEHGPDAIGGVSSSRSINEDSYQMQKLFRSVIGTNNIDNCART